MTINNMPNWNVAVMLRLKCNSNKKTKQIRYINIEPDTQSANNKDPHCWRELSNNLIFMFWEKFMSKGYLIANLRVQDEKCFNEYSEAAVPLIERFGGKLLARGPGADRHEGDLTGLVALLEFESKAAAEKFYFSDEYQASKVIRDNGVDTDLMIIEGI